MYSIDGFGTLVPTLKENLCNCLFPRLKGNGAGLEELSLSQSNTDSMIDCELGEVKHWFVMRDLTRVNANRPAYVILKELGLNFFTPMQWRLYIKGARRERRLVPVIHDLIFVNESRLVLDKVVSSIHTFQYRFQRGCGGLPMTVRDKEMRMFINAVNVSSSVAYYRPDELTPSMINRRIRIIGGALNGYEGTLVTTRGSKVKRLLIQLPSLLAAAVEVEPDYIQLL